MMKTSLPSDDAKGPGMSEIADAKGGAVDVADSKGGAYDDADAKGLSGAKEAMKIIA